MSLRKLQEIVPDSFPVSCLSPQKGVYLVYMTGDKSGIMPNFSSKFHLVVVNVWSFIFIYFSFTKGMTKGILHEDPES